MNIQMTDTDQTLKSLTGEYNKLKSKKDGLTGQIKLLEESLNTLKKDLQQQYAMDDLEKLQELLVDKESENREKCRNYERNLEDLKQKLADVQKAAESDEKQLEDQQ